MAQGLPIKFQEHLQVKKILDKNVVIAEIFSGIFIQNRIFFRCFCF